MICRMRLYRRASSRYFLARLASKVTILAAVVGLSSTPANAQDDGPPPATGKTYDERVRALEILPEGWSPPPEDPRDIEGVWSPGDLPGKELYSSARVPRPDYTPSEGTTLQCAPVSRLGGSGGGESDLWVGDDKMIVMLSEEGRTFRQIYMDGRGHPVDFVPQPNGHSIGRWEDGTLVIDSVGYANPDGSDAGKHTLERITKTQLSIQWALLHEVDITQNGVTTHRTYVEYWRPDYEVYENICEETFGRFLVIDGQIVTPNLDPREGVE